MALNTHKEIENLKKLGADPKLAEGIVALHFKNDEHLATKNDILNLESKLESKIENMGIKLESKIDSITIRLESSIRELNNDSSWIKNISTNILSAIIGAFIAYLIK